MNTSIKKIKGNVVFFSEIQKVHKKRITGGIPAAASENDSWKRKRMINAINEYGRIKHRGFYESDAKAIIKICEDAKITNLSLIVFKALAAGFTIGYRKGKKEGKRV